MTSIWKHKSMKKYEKVTLEEAAWLLSPSYFSENDVNMRLPHFLEKNFEVFSGFLGFMENPKRKLPCHRMVIPLIATSMFCFHDPLRL